MAFPKIKPIWWIIIIAISSIIPLALVFVITRIVIEPALTWWWLLGVLFGEIGVGIIAGAIIIFVRLKKIQPIKTRLDPKTAKEKAIYEKKYDEDNPDNFKVTDQVVMRVGAEGSAKTSVLWLTGKGTEKNEQIDCIVNLDNTKFEASWLTNKTKEQVKEAIMRIAENPEIEIKEEKKFGYDEYGRPVGTISTRKLNQAEKKEEEEKKQAEEANTI